MLGGFTWIINNARIMRMRRVSDNDLAYLLLKKNREIERVIRGEGLIENSQAIIER